MKKVKPLNDKVLIEPLEAEDKSKGGIIIPDNAKEKPVIGKIVAVGPGRQTGDGKKRVPMSVKTGDKVLYGKYSGTEVKIEDKEYLLVGEEDIYAKL